MNRAGVPAYPQPCADKDYWKDVAEGLRGGAMAGLTIREELSARFAAKMIPLVVSVLREAEAAEEVEVEEVVVPTIKTWANWSNTLADALIKSWEDE